MRVRSSRRRLKRGLQRNSSESLCKRRVAELPRHPCQREDALAHVVRKVETRAVATVNMVLTWPEQKHGLRRLVLR